MILADYHSHTSFSTDSDTPPHKQAEAAIRSGLLHLCITDHYDHGYPGGDFMLNPDIYYPAIQKLISTYSSQIKLHAGIELGLWPLYKQETEQIAARYPWEFIIGSSHVVDGQDPYYPDYWEAHGIKKGLLHYYEATLNNIQSFDCFDVYGHIDYIIRYIPQSGRSAYNSRDYDEIIDEILRCIIEKGKGIECNTAGFKYGLGHPNPTEAILTRYFELGGEILTIGSDGHKPEHIAYDFNKLPALLHSCGARYYTIFENRKPIMLPID